MKVLNIIPRYPPAIGGSESWCEKFCLFLVAKGIVTKVATINMYNVGEAFDKNFIGEEFIKLGEEDYDKGVFIKRYELWKLWSNSPSAKIISFLLTKLKLNKTQLGDIFITSPNSLEMYKNLIREIRNCDIVVIHTLPYFHNLVGFLFAKLYRKVIFAVPHFHPGHLQFERKIFFKMLNACDAVIAVSEHEKKYLINKNISTEKIFVSGNAVNLEQLKEDYFLKNFKAELFREYKIKDNSKKIIFIGRKEVYKGVFVLIDVLNRLTGETGIDLYLFLIGPDTPDFNRIYPTVNKSGRLHIINFGVVSEEEKETLLQLSDVLVLPSEFEAFGIVFLEAWKYGKPVVGINRGAVPDVIGDAGLCAEYGNTADLKDKIKKILFDEKLASEMGAKGREKVVNQYSIEKVYGKVANIFNNIRHNKRRILVVSQLFPPHYIGGSEIAAYEQSKMLRNLGWNVKIFAGKINDSERRFKITHENASFETIRVNLHGIDFYHEKYINFDKDELREKFREELYSYAPEVVHFHNIYGLSLGMIEDCREMNMPTVMTLHDYWGICPKNLLLNEKGNVCIIKDGKCVDCKDQLILESSTSISNCERNQRCLEYYKKIDLLISPSWYLAERFIERGLPREKFRIIRYGINLSRFKARVKVNNKKIRFGFMGQIIWHKGLDIFLEALLFLDKGEKDKISVLIVGTGEEPYLSYCKSMAKEMDFVRFLGKVPHDKTQNIYKLIDVLVAPSRWPENSPLVIQEAMACGIPVIAPDFGAIPEIIKDGCNGLLFRVNNPESFAEKIREVIERPDKICAMSLVCVKSAEENNLIEKVRTMINEYEDIISLGLKEKLCANRQ